MKKYLIVTIIELILLMFFGLFNKINNDILEYIFLFTQLLFPILIISLSIINTIKKIKKYTEFIFLPFLLMIPITYIYDGRTVAVTNPDSSIFNWYTYVYFIHYLLPITISIYIITIIICKIVSYLLNKKNKNV